MVSDRSSYNLLNFAHLHVRYLSLMQNYHWPVVQPMAGLTLATIVVVPLDSEVDKLCLLARALIGL